jgi:hypothetical protein
MATNPISKIIESKGPYAIDWTDAEFQSEVRAEILAAGIPGLMDIRFKEEPHTIRIIPVFDTEQNYMWYHLKYTTK